MYSHKPTSEQTRPNNKGSTNIAVNAFILNLLTDSILEKFTCTASLSFNTCVPYKVIIVKGQTSLVKYPLNPVCSRVSAHEYWMLIQ